jgi:hypothetical protein
VRSLAPSAASAAAAAVVLAALATRVGDWAIMTDELLYQRLAISIGETGLPRLRGDFVAVYALLYPFVLSPVFAIVDMPDAVVVAHGWNAVLFASSAIPAYLLARTIGLSQAARLLAAVVAVVVPWSVTAGFLMTESAAYPASLWAGYLILRAALRPGDGTYALAVLGIGLATLARPQLIVFAVALLAAALTVELRERRGLVVHRVLGGAVAFTLLMLVLLAATGSLGSALGSYAPTIEEGALVSGGALRSAAVHLDVLAIAIGLVPLLLGGGWALEALVRRPPRIELHAFAAFVVTSVGLLALQVGSFVERFALGVDVKDRYLFYVAPLLFVATAAALEDPRPRLVGLLAVTSGFVLTVGWEQFEPVFGVNLDSPAAATHEWLTRVLGDPATWLAVAGGLVAVVLVIALRALPRQPVAYAVLGAITLFCALETTYTWDRLLASSGPSARPLKHPPPDALSWVDANAPDDAVVGMLPYSVGQEWYASAIAWWDVEFWNARVQRGFLVGNRFTYAPAPFAHPRLSVDYETGEVRGSLTPYLVRTRLDARFAPAGEVVAGGPDYELLRVASPARAAWVTRGLDADGWTRPTRAATLRVYGQGEVNVAVSLNAPGVTEPRGYDLGGAQIGYLTESERRDLTFAVCAAGHADIPIRILGSTAIREVPIVPPYSGRFREVGVRLSHVAATPTGRACPP